MKDSNFYMSQVEIHRNDMIAATNDNQRHYALKMMERAKSALHFMKCGISQEHAFRFYQTGDLGTK